LAENRLAFTAAYWGQQAVVCRALENRPGPAVDQEFGEFASWTEANSFATKLNEGLDLSPEDTRQIINSALLASPRWGFDLPNRVAAWSFSPISAEAERLRWETMQARLDLALTFCKLLHNYRDEFGTVKTIQQVRNTMNSAIKLLLESQRDRSQLTRAWSKVHLLQLMVAQLEKAAASCTEQILS
jgi:hypothetical protein